MVTSGGGGMTVLDHLFFGDYRPRVQFSYQTGDGIGYVDQYMTIGGFLPLWQGSTSYLPFADMRVLLEDGRVGCNLGLGNRLYVERLNATIGGYGFYDNRNTGQRTVSQVSGGIDMLGDSYDLRFNGYVPLDTDSQLVATPLTNAFFVGNQLYSNQLYVYETALMGFDTEAGGRLFSIGVVDLWAFMGAYHYQGNNTKQAWGPRARLEARTGGMLNAQVAVANDRLFGTTVVFSVAANFPSSRPANSNKLDQAVDRLADPIERTWNVVVHENQVGGSTLVYNPTTNSEFQVIHVQAGASGTGTVEDPAGSVSQAVALAGENAIIYVHDNGTTMVGNIVLKSGQRLLGSSDNQLVTTTTGYTTIAATSSSRPVLTANTGNVITLASGVTVSGFDIENAPGNAIAGLNVNNVVVTNNTINGAGANAINLVNAQTGFIANNTITSSYREAIYVNNTNTQMSLTIQTNDISSNNTSGGGTGAINITNTSSSTPDSASELFILSNKIEENTGTGVSITSLGSSDLGTLVQTNLISENTGAGVSLISKDQATTDLLIDQNDILANGAAGVAAAISGSSSGLTQIQISTSTISNNEGAGVQITGTESSQTQMWITSSAIEYNGGNGVNLNTSASSVLAVSLTETTLNGNQYGLRWSASNTGGAASSLTLSTNTFSNNYNSGVRIDTTNDAGISLAATSNTFTANSDRGIHLTVEDTSAISAQVVGNQFSSNGLEGLYLESTSVSDESSLSALVKSNTFTGSADSSVHARVEHEGRINLELISNTSNSSYLLDNDADVDTNEQGRIRYTNDGNNVGTVKTEGDGTITQAAVGTFFAQ